MSNQINDGGPALPTADAYHPSGQIAYGRKGMTLRDWFAGQETLEDLDGPECSIQFYFLEALAGPKPIKPHCEDPIAWAVWESTWRANLKYIRADAMLKARGGAK
jgi:hypothetical protein